MSLDKPQPRSTFAAVPPTSWTLLQRIVAAETNERDEFLGQLVVRYWKPLYAYFRSKGKSPADAEDLVQGKRPSTGPTGSSANWHAPFATRREAM